MLSCSNYDFLISKKMATVGEPPAPLPIDVIGGPFICSCNHFEVPFLSVFINLEAFIRGMLAKVLDLNLALKRQMNNTQPFCSQTPGISLSGLVGTRACTQTQQGKGGSTEEGGFTLQMDGRGRGQGAVFERAV